MTTTTLAPDAILELTNLTGALASIDEPVSSPDASWITRTGSGDQAIRVSFPAPGGTLSGTQTFRTWLRRWGSVDASAALRLYVNGAGDPQSSGNVTINSGSGQIVSLTWTASASDPSGLNTELRIATGGHAQTGMFEVGAVEWIASYAASAISLSANGIVVGSPDLPTLTPSIIRALTAIPQAVGSPVLGTPALLGGFFTLSAVGFSVGNATIGAPEFNQKVPLTASPLTVGRPQLQRPGEQSLAPVGLTVGSPVLPRPRLSWQPFVRHGPYAPEPTHSQQIREAVAILKRALDRLVEIVPTKAGRVGWDFRRSAGELRVDGEGFIADGTLGTPLAECFALARQAGASFEGFESFRRKEITEAPTSVPAQGTAHLIVRLALIQMTQITATTDFVSRDDANKALVRTAAAFEPAEEDAADEQDAGAYRALVTLRAAAVRDLVDRGRLLPRIVPYSFAERRPSLWMANRIYGDGSRYEELSAENKFVHPAFAPEQGICLSR